MNLLNHYLNNISPVVWAVAQVMLIMAIGMTAMVLVSGLRPGQLPLGARLVGRLTIVALAGSLAWAVCTFPPMILAKVWLSFCMISFGLSCIIILCNLSNIEKALTQVQYECDLASNLAFLQGEMVRAQLENLHDRIQKAVEPQEREFTESMLKTISPLVMLYFKKETSVLKWSLAAAGLGKRVIQYFLSPPTKN